MENLELGLNFSWNSLEMDADVFAAQGGVPIRLFEKGDRLNLSPKYTIGASAAYAFPVGTSGFRGRLSASANYISEQDNRALLASVVFRQGDATLLSDASFSLEAPESWIATLFIDNLTNQQGIVIGSPNTPEWNSRLRPRTVGVQLEYRF